MEQKTGAKVRISWDAGKFLLLIYSSQKTSTSPLYASICKLCLCSHNLSRSILFQAIVLDTLNICAL